MIYHVADAGAIRTDPRDPNVLVCQLDGAHRWLEKVDCWRAATNDTDVPNDTLAHPETVRITSKLPRTR